MTHLDEAHARIEASDAARVQFYGHLANAELYVILDAEPTGDAISPRLHSFDSVDYVLAFDTEARLAEFTGETTPYAALPGRILAEMLAGAGLGLGLNVDVAPSATLIPADALHWLTDTLEAGLPQEHLTQPESVHAPAAVPVELREALGAMLTTSAGLADRAYLAEVAYADGQRTRVLAIEGAAERAEPALARAVSEALTFSGLEDATLDVVFLTAGQAMTTRFAKVGLRFDVPQPAAAPIPAAPGSDPAKPPKLR